MSRDNSIYFMNADFPTDEWASILSVFQAKPGRLDELDQRHCIIQKWFFDGVHGAIHVDLTQIDPRRHSAPPNCRWRIGVHCNGHRGIHHWFLYAIPLYAIARFDDTIFSDGNSPDQHVAACDLAGIEKRMHIVLPSRCEARDLVEQGYTSSEEPYWPQGLNRNSEKPASVATRQALISYCREHSVTNLSDNSPMTTDNGLMTTDQSQSPNEDKAHADIALVCALAVEVNPLLERCAKVRKYTGGKFTFRGGRYDEIRLAVVESGMSFAKARRATEALIEAHTPNWVLAVGFSGGLLPEMKIGDLVMANSIVDTHGNELKVDLKMADDPQQGVYVGRMVTSDAIVRTVKEKKQLAEDYGAIAVDMESLAVAQICKETGTRFLAVRVISDDLSADLPPEVMSVIGSTGAIRVGSALGSLWKRPSSIKDLWRLRENAHIAAGRLATFLDGVLVQLHKTPKT